MPRPVRTQVDQHKIINGRWQHRIRQSDIKRFDHCHESHRRHLLALDPPMQNDSALLGTVFSLYPEAVLNGFTEQAALVYASDSLEAGWNAPGLNQVTFDSLDHAIALLRKACIAWTQQVTPKVPEGSIPERRFSVMAYEDERRVVIFEGTSDLWLSPTLNKSGGMAIPIWDWKFSGRSYIGQHAWKQERYDPQPVHYCMARSLIEQRQCYDFTFVNILRDDTKGMKREPVVEWLPVKLTMGDFKFHLQRCLNMAKMIEKLGFDDPWPLGPTDWWCSSTWCPSWDECRGKHIGHDPWGNLAKRLKT